MHNSYAMHKDKRVAKIPTLPLKALIDGKKFGYQPYLKGRQDSPECPKQQASRSQIRSMEEYLADRAEKGLAISRLLKGRQDSPECLKQQASRSQIRSMEECLADRADPPIEMPLCGAISKPLCGLVSKSLCDATGQALPNAATGKSLDKCLADRAEEVPPCDSGRR